MIKDDIYNLRYAAKEHGYKGIFGIPRLLCKYFYNYILCGLAHHMWYGWPARLHRLRGVKIGKYVEIQRDIIIDEMHPKLITIEDYVGIAAKVVIMAHARYGPYLRDYVGNDVLKPVKIKKGAFIGIGAIILPGVTIGEGSIVGAGAVVTKNVPDHVVVVGVPAKVIKKLEKRK